MEGGRQSVARPPAQKTARLLTSTDAAPGVLSSQEADPKKNQCHAQSRWKIEFYPPFKMSGSRNGAVQVLSVHLL
jgi:hypothetical protein